jgi:hypothetical protein
VRSGFKKLFAHRIAVALGFILAKEIPQTKDAQQTQSTPMIVVALAFLKASSV